MIMKMKKKIHRLLFPKSLRYQLLMRMLFILSFILLVIGALQYLVMKDFLYRNEAETLQARMMSLPRAMVIRSEQLFPDAENRNTNETYRFRFLLMNNISLAVVRPNDEITDLLGSNGLPAPHLAADEYLKLTNDSSINQEITYKVVSNFKGTDQLIVIRPLGVMQGALGSESEQYLQMGTDVEPIDDILFQQLLTFIALSAIALSIGLVIYFSVIRRTLAPLSNIIDSVENTNVGNLSDRIMVDHGQEEIDRLSHAFNQMLERLESAFIHERETKEQMRRFIADASHELRTPLTSIHGFLEVLLRGAANRPEQLESALNSMHGESKRIIKLVEDLLLLTKLDRAPELQLSETNLTELIHVMEPQLNVLAGSRTVCLNLAVEAWGYYDSDKMKQVILNLFHNSVQHTDAHSGNIHLSLFVKDDHTILTVDDNGSGINEKDLPHVFDRFYRIDSSRTRKNGGAGLGLSISKSIVEAHRGSISVQSVYGVGTTFTVSFPLS